MVMLNRVTEKTTLGKNEKNLKEDLESGISNATVESINKTEEFEGLTDVYYVSKNGQYVTVYEDGDIEDGKVEVWDGKKVSSPEFKKENNIWNWYIYTPSQLKFLADFVNNGNKLEGRDDLKKLVEDANYDTNTVTMSTDTMIYLMNNLDLGARQKDGEKTTGENWIPIGINLKNVKNKLGTFEGNNYTIKGLYSTTANYCGLFGTSNTIQNLTIKNSYAKGVNAIGGIVGSILSGQVYNCNNYNTTVIGTGQCVGGITGLASGMVNKCNNNGVVKGSDQFVGGITGRAYSMVEECNNSGAVVGKVRCVGGIAGATNSEAIISNCNNSGTIKGESGLVGGIVGYLKKSTVKLCNNSGTVTGTGERIGGIVGDEEPCSIVSESRNYGGITGNVENSEGIGGIVGTVSYTDDETNSKVEKCYNNGTVNGETKVGGIIGLLAGSLGKGTVTECYNKGKIMGTAKVGEVIGTVSTIGLNTLNKLFYLKNERGLTAIYGESDDNETKGIMAIDKDMTYEQFKEWIEEQ